MIIQEIKNESGEKTGVFIPIREWELIQSKFPDIETLDEDIQKWEKDFIDTRLQSISAERLKPIEQLFDELNKRI
ncbi:addiction module component CHP02574 family protein [Lacihabitans sp. CCS-44]|uniref:addiction module component CHP02574 family protein n=1 Tax=Lacihabitans sp. CCS-44 TaxID=2487331 RepID=UPI0020CEEEE6|nr:addiction module component CHP02574 family protein [Lacihabitans sp. CCS-44]MCP9753872.1 addiction module component CHP02574 family protein [Lacihabitans sp. CCS-44]